GELEPRADRLGSKLPRKQGDDFLQAGTGALIVVERVASAASLADENDLGRRLQVGQLGMRVIGVPDDLIRWPFDPTGVEQLSQVALGLGRLPTAERPSRWLFGDFRRERLIASHDRVVRKWIEDKQRRAPLLHILRQTVNLLLRERRWLSDQQHVEIRRDRR